MASLTEHRFKACPVIVRTAQRGNKTLTLDWKGIIWAAMDGTRPPKPRLSYAHGTGGPPLWGCTIGEALDCTALLCPDQPALISRHQRLRYSYREFLAEVEQAAQGFLQLGVGKGDRVGVWTTNYAEWV